MNPESRKRESGSALLVVLVLIVVIVGVAGSMLAKSLADGRNAETAVVESRSLAIAEAGAHAGLGSLLMGGSGALGSATSPIPYNSGGGHAASAYYTQVYDNADNTKSIVSRSNFGGVAKGVEMVVRQNFVNLTFNVRAGITCRSSVQCLGNFVGDGRDWNETGTALVGPGVRGISSMSTIGVGGSSQVGGAGLAPTSTPGPAIIEEHALWPTGFPPTPDASLHIEEGTLKMAAIRSGTYCRNQADWDALRTAYGGHTPPGKIIYIEPDPAAPIIVPFELGDVMNDAPSIIVVHNSACTATMKNLHGLFKGLVLSDDIDHENSGSLMVGAIMTFRPNTGGNCFGNGAANFRFSSAVLSRLPACAAALYSILSWREFPAYLTGRPPVATGGLVAATGGS